MPRPSISACAAAFGQAALCIVDGPHLAVGHDRDRQGLADAGDAVPVRRRPVAVHLRAAVHHQFRRAGGPGCRARCPALRSSSRWPRRIFALTGTCKGTARRTAATMACTTSGSSSSTAPPRWRLTVGAGQPKFRSTPSAPISASRAPLSAITAGSLPSSCGRTGTPAAVRLPFSNSGTTRVNTRGGSRRSVTRMNSDTQRSIPPTRVSASAQREIEQPFHRGEQQADRHGGAIVTHRRDPRPFSARSPTARPRNRAECPSGRRSSRRRHRGSLMVCAECERGPQRRRQLERFVATRRGG